MNRSIIRGLQSNASSTLPDLEHREFQTGPFWQVIPAYANIDEPTFLDHKWQSKNTITTIEKLIATVGALVPESFFNDALAGLQKAPMSIRISPYILALMDWKSPDTDPLRIQFLPLRSQQLPDHPCVSLDSLAEVADAPVPGLTHRYSDKALFLALDTCPVYCRFCTRSYAVGTDTAEVGKLVLNVNEQRWKQAFDYIAAHPEIEDIVISGGDAYNLRAQQILDIGQTLLAIPHIRRMRYATKGLAVMPQKILTDSAWVDALTTVVDQGRKMHKEVVIHTHFAHPREITDITKRAIELLKERAIVIRNQCVLIKGVNDNARTMTLLIKKLGYMNVQPYFVYVHDMVKGVEDLRTTVQSALDIEKSIRGATAGFYTPVFAVDTPGGGGKRDAHSFEHYNRTTGISVYVSPVVKPGRFFYYFDPIHLLPPEGQARWADPAQHQVMIDEATRAARG